MLNGNRTYEWYTTRTQLTLSVDIYFSNKQPRHNLEWLKFLTNFPISWVLTLSHTHTHTHTKPKGITIKAQHRMHVTAETRNPDSFVTAGIARIPHPPNIC